jgi:hypothetical protein
MHWQREGEEVGYEEISLYMYLNEGLHLDLTSPSYVFLHLAA